MLVYHFSNTGKIKLYGFVSKLYYNMLLTMVSACFHRYTNCMHIMVTDQNTLNFIIMSGTNQDFMPFIQAQFFVAWYPQKLHSGCPYHSYRYFR